MKGKLQRYVESDVKYTDQVLRSDVNTCHIMSDHETLIMEESAKVVCQNGGSVLNVGFGMGIIDGFIRQHRPEKHTIIDIHPQVIQKAIEMGFNESATLLEGDWKTYVNQWKEDGTKFDGIYFDTFSFEDDQWFNFVKEVDSILNPGGIFSYFNYNAANWPERSLPEYIQDNYNYKMESKIIPFEDMLNAVPSEYDFKLLTKKDYNLLWYTKQ